MPIINIPDELFESSSFGAFNELQVLHSEYGGLPLPLPHKAVLDVLALVRAIREDEPHLTRTAEEWEAKVLGLAHPPSPSTPLQDRPYMTPPPTRIPDSDSESPSFFPPQARMTPMLVAPEVDVELEHGPRSMPPTPLAGGSAVPVAPEQDEETEHYYPEPSPSGLQSRLAGMDIADHTKVNKAHKAATVPIVRAPRSVMAPSARHAKTAATTPGIPRSPGIRPPSNLPYPSMGSEYAPREDSHVALERQIEALVAIQLNYARHLAGQPLKPVHFFFPVPNLPPLTSEDVISHLSSQEHEAWLQYYLGEVVSDNDHHEVLKACVGLR